MNDRIRNAAESMRLEWFRTHSLPDGIHAPEPGHYRTWMVAYHLGGMSYADYFHLLEQLIESPDDKDLDPGVEYPFWCQLGDDTIEET